MSIDVSGWSSRGCLFVQSALLRDGLFHFQNVFSGGATVGDFVHDGGCKVNSESSHLSLPLVKGQVQFRFSGKQRVEGNAVIFDMGKDDVFFAFNVKLDVISAHPEPSVEDDIGDNFVQGEFQGVGQPRGETVFPAERLKPQGKALQFLEIVCKR